MKSVGTLRYSGAWLVLDIDPELARYYRTMIPKDRKFNKPKYPPHITVINGKYETPSKLDVWGKYEGEKIEFEYDSDIKIGDLYIWLSVSCDRFEEIRTGLGLGKFIDQHKGFHITVANMKEI